MRKINDKVKTLIFSRNRAMQLDLCLNSLYKCCTDTELPEIDVLYTADEEHRKSYEILAEEHPFVNLIWETNFDRQLKESLNKKFILFCVDDTIWVNLFSINEIIRLLEDYNSEYLLGFSLRLGENTQYCYSLDKLQKVPTHVDHSKYLKYYWPNAEYDFVYPLEVSSSIYETYIIQDIINEYKVPNPNYLESLLDFYKSKYFYTRPELACYKKSVSFAAPMNRVQNSAPNNRFENRNYYNAPYLNKLYLDKWRIDYNHYYGMTSNAAHQEVDYEFIRIENE